MFNYQRPVEITSLWYPHIIFLGILQEDNLFFNKTNGETSEKDVFVGTSIIQQDRIYLTTGFCEWAIYERLSGKRGVDVATGSR